MSLYALCAVVLADMLGLKALSLSKFTFSMLLHGGASGLAAAVPFVPDWARVRGSGCALAHSANASPPATAVAAATGLALGSLPPEIQDTLLAEEMLFAFMVRHNFHASL